RHHASDLASQVNGSLVVGRGRIHGDAALDCHGDRGRERQHVHDDEHALSPADPCGTGSAPVEPHAVLALRPRVLRHVSSLPDPAFMPETSPRYPRSMGTPDDDSPREAGKLPKGRIARTTRVGGLVTGQGLRWAGMRTANRMRTPERAAEAQKERT